MGRFSTLIKAKISKLLDRAENPGETLYYAYEKQLEQIQVIRKGIVDVVTAKKRLQTHAAALERQVQKLDIQARTTIRVGRGPSSDGDRAQAAHHRGERLAFAADRRPRAPAGANEHLRVAVARQDRGVPLPQGGDQGPVLRCRGAGPDLRGGSRHRERHGGRRLGSAAGDRQDRDHAGTRERGAGTRGRPARSKTSLRSVRRRTTSTGRSRCSARATRSTRTWHGSRQSWVGRPRRPRSRVRRMADSRRELRRSGVGVL